MVRRIRFHRWLRVLALVLWMLVMCGIPLDLWVIHLLRQVGRSDQAGSNVDMVIYLLVAVSAATVGDGSGEPPTTPSSGLASTDAWAVVHLRVRRLRAPGLARSAARGGLCSPGRHRLRDVDLRQLRVVAYSDGVVALVAMDMGSQNRGRCGSGGFGVVGAGAAPAAAAPVAVAVAVIATLVLAGNEASLSWLVGVCLAILPVAIGAAILRYRLYDLDRIISRTLAYGLLTALLGGVYAGVVLGLGQLLGSSSSLAVAIATLAVAGAFQPARRSIQQLVDRRFNRGRYEAAQTVHEFSAQLRQQVDLDALTAELLAVVKQTMQPTEASLWSRPSVSGSLTKSALAD